MLFRIANLSSLATRKFAGLVTLALVALVLAAPASAQVPFQERIQFTIPAGQFTGCVAFSVPANNRLTVQFVSVLIEATLSGQSISGVNLFTTINGQPEPFFVIPVTVGGPAHYWAAQVLTAYADAGTSPRVCVSRSPLYTSGALNIYGSLSGTLNAM